MKIKRSARADIVTRRTYCRPKEDGTFETFNDVIDRVIDHQKWLWERAKGSDLSENELIEIERLKLLMIERKVSLSGRCLWLGGTNIGRTRESSMFNCSGLLVKTVHDIVDLWWLLLQGAGVGFKPETGVLTGFKKPIKNIKVMPSERTEKGGNEENEENYDSETGVWTLKLGDSAESWAKFVGKLLVHKYPATELILDFSEIRPAGERLKGYGWICSGHAGVSKAVGSIASILNKRCGDLLTKIDILDICNWLGTTLSSRRSAQIAMMDYGDLEWKSFALAKKEFWLYDNEHRQMSNNSLLFHEKPSKHELYEIFKMMKEAGGSEPGFLNMQEAKKRAKFCSTFNPCAEILLADRSFCNLSELDVGKFKGDTHGMMQALYLLGRANYRQTCVNLKDGILQESWHLNNDFLRLCGVGLTGIIRRPDLTEYDYQMMRREVTSSTYSMADELDMPRPKNSTTVKPSGCRPKYELVTTDKGIFTLNDLLENHEKNSFWSEFHDDFNVIQDDETNPITQTFDNGVEDVYRITMNYGLSVDSTLNHPWFVSQTIDRSKRKNYKKVNSWVKTKDIKPNDILQTYLGVYNKKDSQTLLTFESLPNTSTFVIKQPSSMNPDISWLLGYFWGNGSRKKKNGRRFSFSDRDTFNLVKLKRILKENFNLDVKINNCKEGVDCRIIEFGSVQFGMWMDFNNISKYDNDFFPKCVRTSSVEDIIAFIAGLTDSDGCISELKGGYKRVIFSQKSENFSRHFQNIAWSVGLGFGRSHNTKGSGYGKKEKDLWLMTLGQHVDSDSLFLFDKHSEKVKFVHPNLQWKCSSTESTKKIVAGKVLKVEKIGKLNTYDIEVENSHWFYAGCVKSHNTLSKAIFDTTEGMHRPIGRYVFNNISFHVHDPLIEELKNAGYKTFSKPGDPDGVLVTIPVEYPDVEFDQIDGKYVNVESAISQLERYKMLMRSWCDQNVSSTIYYSPEEVPLIVEWLYNNWDDYVGVSFLYRPDPTKTAKDLGYEYLPQEVVLKEEFEDYVSKLKPINFEGTDTSDFEVESQECESGACPVK